MRTQKNTHIRSVFDVSEISRWPKPLIRFAGKVFNCYQHPISDFRSKALSFGCQYKWYILPKRQALCVGGILNLTRVIPVSKHVLVRSATYWWSCGGRSWGWWFAPRSLWGSPTSSAWVAVSSRAWQSPSGGPTRLCSDAPSDPGSPAAGRNQPARRIITIRQWKSSFGSQAEDFISLHEFIYSTNRPKQCDLQYLQMYIVTTKRPTFAERVMAPISE